MFSRFLRRQLRAAQPPGEVSSDHARFLFMSSRTARSRCFTSLTPIHGTGGGIHDGLDPVSVNPQQAHFLFPHGPNSFAVRARSTENAAFAQHTYAWLRLQLAHVFWNGNDCQSYGFTFSALCKSRPTRSPLIKTNPALISCWPVMS